MSRAFTKEADDAPDPRVPRAPASQYPRYLTPGGLQAMHKQLDAARREGNERESEALSEKIEQAIVIDPRDATPDVVEFGATVTVRDERGVASTYTIVGEDEADPHKGRIAWLSPLAQAILERRVGESAIWPRPIGDLRLTILAIEYV